MATASDLGGEVINFVRTLLTSVPQYVLGVLPAIAILGASPRDGLWCKFEYLFRSLGSPFSGLFYYMNVKNDRLKMTLYWLEPENFRLNGHKKLKYKPFGFHAKKVQQSERLDLEQRQLIEEC